MADNPARGASSAARPAPSDAEAFGAQLLARLMGVHSIAMEEREGVPPWEPRSIDCVVWRADGAAVRSELLAALRQPGIHMKQVLHPFDATAAALAANRQREARRRRSPVVLVLVEPAMLDRCIEVVDVLQRFAAGVEFWAFEQVDGMHRLRVLRPSDVERWKLEVHVNGVGGRDGQAPTTELPKAEIKVMEEFRTPRGPRMSPVEPAVSEPPANPSPAQPRLLSDEELRMLLEPDSREPGDGAPGTT